MGKIFTTISFVFITPIILIILVSFTMYLSYQKNHSDSKNNRLYGKDLSYAALPTLRNLSRSSIKQNDARIELVRQFFSKYKSPLEPYAKDIVFAADAYNLDFRLLPAIAMQESNLCKKAPLNSFNCWGFGIYGKQVKRFTSYPEAIEVISRSLAKKYLNQGLDTPEAIMTRYTPSSNGSWAYAVTHFMDQLQ